MRKFITWFVKITGFPVQYFYFKKQIFYESKKCSRKIKGPALIISNHTSVYDFPLVMYTFLGRNIRTLIAKELFEKNWMLTVLLKGLGGIKVERQNYNFSFMNKMIHCLKKKQVGLIFPEGRIPKEEERTDFLPFKPSYIYIALESRVPIIPVYTNGIYGKLKKQYKSNAKIIIGEPIYITDLYDSKKNEKENIDFINNYIRDYIKNLKIKLESESGC